MIRPAVNTVISKLAGNEQGFAAGMNNAYMSLGNMIGPALAGMFFDININLSIYYWMRSFYYASWGITLYGLRRKKPS